MENKKSILFITPYPKGEAPSQRFRFEQYLSTLENKYDIKQRSFWNKKSWDSLYQKSNFFIKFFNFLTAFIYRFFLLFKLYKFDYIFIHREATPIGPPFIEFTIAKILQKKIIYDFDDAIWIHNVSDKNKAVKYLKSNWKVKFICKWSYKVVCGNNYLSTYAKQFNDNVVVIPTTIDFNYHKNIEKNDSLLTIGWTGTHSTLKHLDFLIPTIKRLENDFEFKFLVISDKKPTYSLKSLEFIAWNKTSEIEDLNRINIGVMPLYDSKWEKGKCGFKGLQYMSLGVPTVMSPIGVNTEIINDKKNGFLAKEEDEWYIILSELLVNPELRKNIGQAGKLTIKHRYSVAVNTPKYLNLFD